MKQASEIAEELYNKVMVRARHLDEQDVGEYVSMRLLNAIEWASPKPEMCRVIANKLITNHQLPKGGAIIIRRYFDLNY